MSTQCRGMNIFLILLLSFTIIAAAVNKNDTLPFVRSRYSHRWRNLIVGATRTPGTTTENVMTTTNANTPSLITVANSVEVGRNEEDNKLRKFSARIATVSPKMKSVVDPLTISSFFGHWITTTDYSRQLSFTHSTDYDYYSENEIEEANNLN